MLSAITSEDDGGIKRDGPTTVPALNQHHYHFSTVVGQKALTGVVCRTVTNIINYTGNVHCARLKHIRNFTHALLVQSD